MSDVHAIRAEIWSLQFRLRKAEIDFGLEAADEAYDGDARCASLEANVKKIKAQGEKNVDVCSYTNVDDLDRVSEEAMEGELRARRLLLRRKLEILGAKSQ